MSTRFGQLRTVITFFCEGVVWVAWVFDARTGYVSVRTCENETMQRECGHFGIGRKNGGTWIGTVQRCVLNACMMEEENDAHAQNNDGSFRRTVSCTLKPRDCPRATHVPPLPAHQERYPGVPVALLVGNVTAIAAASCIATRVKCRSSSSIHRSIRVGLQPRLVPGNTALPSTISFPPDPSATRAVVMRCMEGGEQPVPSTQRCGSPLLRAPLAHTLPADPVLPMPLQLLYSWLLKPPHASRLPPQHHRCSRSHQAAVQLPPCHTP
mmetsp:Transcript_15708/g.43392  ORF Transcript_15708/g.43392 Transcript_15708/m.43392 type:complete len:267 (+) Transcript_15708:492-1292(+)